MISKSAISCLLGGMAITAVGAVSGGGTATAATLSGLLGWLAGVLGNRVGDEFGRILDATPPPADEIFRNHHISALIGQAIASVADNYVLSQDRFDTCRHEIEGVCKQAPAAWLEFIQNAPGEFDLLREINLPEQLRCFAQKGGQTRLLEIEDWRGFLRSFTTRPDGSCSLTPEAFEAFARGLHEHLAEALWNWIKYDFSNDGRAYAATEMLFLSRILQSVENLQKSFNPPVEGIDASQVENLIEAGLNRQTDIMRTLDEENAKRFAKLFAQHGESKQLLLQLLNHYRELLKRQDEVPDKITSRLASNWKQDFERFRIEILAVLERGAPVSPRIDWAPTGHQFEDIRVDVLSVALHRDTYASAHNLERLKKIRGIRFHLVPPGITRKGIRNSEAFYIAETLVSEDQWVAITSSKHESRRPDVARINLSFRMAEAFFDAARKDIPQGMRLSVPTLEQWMFVLAFGAGRPQIELKDKARLYTGASSFLGLHDLEGVAWQFCRISNKYELRGACFSRRLKDDEESPFIPYPNSNCQHPHCGLRLVLNF